MAPGELAKILSVLGAPLEGSQLAGGQLKDDQLTGSQLAGAPLEGAPLEEPPDENLLLGFATSDDAAVYRINDEVAAVLTVDFFTPMVDDPYDFGCIAAANALSDIYAMGAQPLVALNLLAFPPELERETVGEIIRGGRDTALQAGALIAGGHTIEDAEPKYGLAVFGTVQPGRVVRNQGALPGDALYYTKHLGIGIMLSALGADIVTPKQAEAVIAEMKELNSKAALAMLAANARAATDVTGFGLAGHLHEMLMASAVAARIDCAKLPVFAGVLDLSAAMCRPGKSFAIIEWLEGFLINDGLDPEQYETWLGVVCDPQTSGGLLVSIPADKQQLFVETFEGLTGELLVPIGQIIEGEAGTICLSI